MRPTHRKLVEPLSWRLTISRPDSGGGGASAPTFLSSATFSAPEGADYEFTLDVDQVCDITIQGGVDANQFQIIGGTGVSSAPLTLFSQTYTGVDDTYDVTVRATSVSTGLSTDLAITATVTDVAVPVNTVPAAVTGRNIEGYILTATPGTWTGATSVTGQWYQGTTAITGETGLTYTQAEADIGTAIKYKETATNGGGSATQDSNVMTATISGIIARVAHRSTAGYVTDDPRWTYCLVTDAYPTTRGGYEFGYMTGGTTLAFSNTNNTTFPKPLAGQAQGTTNGAAQQFTVPNEEVRVKLSNGGSNVTETQRIIDGTAGSILSSASGVATASTVMGADGVVRALADYDLDAGVLVTPSLGSLTIRNNQAGGFITLRSVEISYPDWGQVTSGVGPYYTSTAGSDLAAGTSSGTAWEHVAGDPGASGVVAGFGVTAGGFNYLNKGETHRVASLAASGGKFIQTPRDGTSGNPITFGAYGTGADPICDGGELLTSWAAVDSGDGAAWTNPNAANMEKKTGLTLTAATVMTDGEKLAFPGQFPNPSNPADYDKSYPGTDAFVALTEAQYTAQSVTQGIADSGGAGFKLCSMTSPDLAGQYSADAISLDGYNIVVLATGARLATCVMQNHNTATGYVEWLLPNTSTLETASTSGGRNWIFAVRGHPYDVRKEGQYAFNLALTTVYGHFASATRGRLSLAYGFKPNKDYVELDGLHLRRVGLAGAAVSDGGGTSSVKTGIALRNVHISQSQGNVGRVVAVSARFGGAGSRFDLENVLIDKIYGQAAIQWEANGDIDGLTIKDAGGTQLLIQNPPDSGTQRRVIQNFSFCDTTGVHQDGLAIYSKAARWTAQQGLIMNHNLPLSTQQDGTVTSRALILKNMVLTPRRQFPGAAWPTSLNTFAMLDDETDGQIEGIVCAGRWSYGHSYANTPSTGTTIKNCVIGGLQCFDLNGLDFENCLFWDITGTGVASLSELTTTKGATDSGGNVFTPSGLWDGTITQAMQQVLTKEGAAATYADRDIGTALKPWVVPAWGSAFALSDCWITTDTCDVLFRADLDFGAIGGTQPGSAISLPALGDNALFSMTDGYVSWVSAAAAGTYSLVVRQTNAHPDLTGPATLDTTITITVA